MRKTISIIMPSKNEQQGLSVLLPRLRTLYPDAEIIVVNDGSTDATENICHENKVHVISHPYSMGNGAAIKTGAREANGDILVFMDADRQHNPEDIPSLLEKLDEGFDMVVAARTRHSQAGAHRAVANGFYNKLASWMTGHIVSDLTSGFRAANAIKFREFLHLLPNGFSYPTTITMAFFRAGYSLSYVPVEVRKRLGKSHIRPVKDGIRFLLIIFRIGTLYSPLKLFLPISLTICMIGLAYYGYTYIHFKRFTNMSALLLLTSMLVFLIGLVSEQITMLIYQKSEKR
ncbi:MAG: glycosyltransferase family 2 protein [Gammaproteobacteria bacterium]|nr:glycosyltransferase family 2 protein [Gammaproteobacteria bacterium]